MPDSFFPIDSIYSSMFLQITGSAAVFLYFLPSLISFLRDHPQKILIFIIDLLAAWPGVGWIACLVWSCTKFSIVKEVILPPTDKCRVNKKKRPSHKSIIETASTCGEGGR
jgi:hypothetical protein